MKKIIRPKQIWDPGDRYAQGVVSKPGRLLFIAGQTAVDGRGKTVGKGNIEAQTRAVLKNIEAVVESAGGSRKNLVATTSYVIDAKHLGGFLQIEARILCRSFANQHHRHRQGVLAKRIPRADRGDRCALTVAREISKARKEKR